VSDPLTQLSQDFQQYANSFQQGFLKPWKANSILGELIGRPMIFSNEEYFLSLLKNSLEMEGFRVVDIELMMGWLYERQDLML
jgi:hypothetical protein